jgi:DNA-directed RNA polymerase subunit RPC12/RpoP
MDEREEIKDLDKVEPIDYGVIAKPHTPVYKMHRYFARRPYTVFNGLIRHYSNPGSIVLDPMCGGGVTIIEGLRLRRKVIGVDLDPMAIFITKMEAINVDLDELKQAFSEISDKVKDEINSLYLTRCPKCGREVPADWFEWSNVVKCPKCQSEVVFAQATKLKAGTYECPHCGETVKSLKGKRKQDKIVRLKLKCDCGFKGEKEPDNYDFSKPKFLSIFVAGS